MTTLTIPPRCDVPAACRWDLTPLFTDSAAWEASLASLMPLAAAVTARRDTLGTSPESLLEALRALAAFQETAEAVGCYASLLTAGDEGDSRFQDMQSRFLMAATAAEAQISFLSPEIQHIPQNTLTRWLAEPAFADHRVMVQKLLRLKAHTLSEAEERILALQSEAAQAAQKAFSLLTNVDISFGTVRVPGEKGDDGARDNPLTQSTFSRFMEHGDRVVRREAYTRFYAAFDTHRHTLAALYEGSVQQDIFEARSRGYSSAIEAALFPDQVPVGVYENLVATVRANLTPLHRYYGLRKRLLGLEELRHYDAYVPLAAGVQTHTPYEQAVEILREALSPLGSEYTGTLCDGLLGGWVDRYENRGKRSGAFSSGSYRSYPYILLNYKDDVLRDLFTIAHEGGHSMHSWYSARSNPFPHYGYTIFEAEVASTFNEQLLFDYLIARADNPAMQRYLMSTRISDILATLYRQTMFAEFELRTHAMVESGVPLTVDSLRQTYRTLLEDYFGPEMVLSPESDLEGLRIPHFYNPFYVYKYATGISAALALADRVTKGGKHERDDYFAFLKSGGSRYPMESLKLAGVDMTVAEPIQAALTRFSGLVNALEAKSPAATPG